MIRRPGALLALLLLAPAPLSAQVYSSAECKGFYKDLEKTVSRQKSLDATRKRAAQKGDMETINGTNFEFDTNKKRIERLRGQLKQCVRDRQ